MKERGPGLDLDPIAKDDRYLILEMACKSYGTSPQAGSELREALINAFRLYRKTEKGRVKIRSLLEMEDVPANDSERQQEFIFSADDV